MNRRQFQPGQKAAHGTFTQLEKTAVKLGNIPDDGQPQSRPRHAFVQPFASFPNLGTLFG